MGTTDVPTLLAAGETRSVEFKSEPKKPLSDSEIVEAVVCLANGSGGDLFIGVDDAGRPTGARPRHGSTTDPIRLQAMIANNTVPQVVTAIEVVGVADVEIIRIQVERAETVVGTRNGLYVRRGIGSDGRPACLPFLAHEMLADRIARGEVDFASIPEPTAELGDLDSAEFGRFRRLAAVAGGRSAALAALGDVELLSALEVAEIRGESVLLRRGALMLFGTSDSLRRFLPTHETAFVVLERGAMQQNIRRTDPLFRSAEDLYERLRSINSESEVVIGLVRVTIDRIPDAVARELVANALVHRDYTTMGCVSVQVEDDELTIASPGGFPRGVTLDNFLNNSAPRSRILAGALNHAGLVDRAGRGINRVFQAALRSGRTQPDYSQSTGDRVAVSVQLGATDLELVRFVIEHDERAGRPFDLAELQIVRALKDDPRQTIGELSDVLQQPLPGTTRRLSRLLEEGIVEMRGNGRGRRFILSASTYHTLSSDAGYVRVRAFDEPQQAQMLLNYIDAHGSISRREAAELCGTSPESARRLLLRLRDQGTLTIEGERRTSRYVRS